MDARLTKPNVPCKALLAAMFLAGGTVHAADAALRDCVARATGLAGVTACEQQRQQELLAQIEAQTQAIRQRLGNAERARFDRSADAWVAWVSAEKDVLRMILDKRGDRLGDSLYPGSVTRLYEERASQLAAQLHSLNRPQR